VSAREVVAYAITHAPKGVKGGPYEGCGVGESMATLALAQRYGDAADAHEDASWLGRLGHTARVIRIVRARPSERAEAEAIAVLRELVAERDELSVQDGVGALDPTFARARRVLAGAGPDPMPLREQPSPGTLAHLRADLKDAIARAETAERALRCQCSEPGDSPCRVHDEERADAAEARASTLEAALEAERGLTEKQRDRAEKAEGLLIQRETELRLAREDGAAVERQMREARGAADASFVRANRAEARAEKAERGRDEAILLHEERRDEEARLCERLERERDTLRDMLTNERDCGQNNVCVKPPGCARHWEARCRELVAERNEARAEVERERARHAQPETKGRATDEELVAIGREAYDEGILEGVPHVPWLARIVRAVAARVRQEGIRWAGGVDFAKQEPGLLERLVAKGCDIKVEENPDGSWAVRLRTVTETLTTNAPAADVPATLARLAGLK
jgi:hypothetical protein